MDIDLDAIGAHVERAPDGAEGVFRFMPAGAAMTDAEQVPLPLRRWQPAASNAGNRVEPAQAGKPEKIRIRGVQDCVMQYGKGGDFGVRYQISRRANRLQKRQDLFNVIGRRFQDQGHGLRQPGADGLRGFAGSQGDAEGAGICRDAHKS
jgi:hypothetical protein